MTTEAPTPSACEAQAPSPPQRRRRRWLRVLLPSLALLLAAGAGWWWYHTTRPGYRMRQARAAIASGDWDRAGDLADRLEDAGQADLANLLRGESLRAQGRPADALAVLNRIHDQGPLRLDAAALSGRCLLELRNLREAHRALSFVLSQDPDHLEARRGLAALAYDLGHMGEAVYHLQEVAKRDPNDGKPHRLIGLIYKYQDRHDQAEAAYQEALSRELPPDMRRAVYLELAQIRVQRTDYKPALEALDEYERLGGEGGPALYLRAECLWKLNRMDEARDLLDSALPDYPREAGLLALRGQIHLAQKQVAQGVRLLEKAVALAPCSYLFRHQLALAYSAAGRKADANAEQKRVAKLRKNIEEMANLTHEATRKPWDADVRLRLAELCQDMEEHQLAAMWFQAARACKKE